MIRMKFIISENLLLATILIIVFLTGIALGHSFNIKKVEEKCNKFIYENYIKKELRFFNPNKSTFSIPVPSNSSETNFLVNFNLSSS